MLCKKTAPKSHKNPSYYSVYFFQKIYKWFFLVYINGIYLTINLLSYTHTLIGRIIISKQMQRNFSRKQRLKIIRLYFLFESENSCFIIQSHQQNDSNANLQPLPSLGF